MKTRLISTPDNLEASSQYNAYIKVWKMRVKEMIGSVGAMTKIIPQTETDSFILK